MIVNNQSYGIYITDSGTTKNTVVGNKIGVDKTGTTALGNVLDGVAIVSGASSNTIGKAGQGNVISGNGHSGVWISGFDNAGPTGLNTVAGNLIGTDYSGIAAIPNAIDGVVINNHAFGNTIGTTDAGGGNVISGNSQWGVYISDAGTNVNVVANNFIGTNVTGTYPVPNTNNGVDIVFGAQSNTIGGTTAAARNLISGNLHEGVLIGFAGTANNVVEGNFIGTDVTGKAFLVSQQQIDGVYVGLGAGSNTIGGQNPLGGLQHRRVERHLGQLRQRHPGHRQRHDRHGDLRQLHRHRRHRQGRLAQRQQRRDDRRRDLQYHGRRGDVRSPESQRDLGQPGRRRLDHLLFGQRRRLQLHWRRSQQPERAAQPRQRRVHPRGVRQWSEFEDVIRNNAGYGILTDSGANHNSWAYNSIDYNSLGGIFESTNPSLQATPVITGVTVAPTGLPTITGTISGSPNQNSGCSFSSTPTRPRTRSSATRA